MRIGIVSFCIGIFMFGFVYILLDYGEKTGYNKGYNIGYNKATYEVTIECGKALHRVIRFDCPELYKMLMENRPMTYTDEIVNKEEENQKIMEAIVFNKGENIL